MASRIHLLNGPSRSWLIFLALMTTAAPLAAQEGIHYVRDRSFKIPMQKGASAQLIQQVLLYVSTDYGKSYQQVAAVKPTESYFPFRANSDGWYWFSSRTHATDGRLHPARVEDLRPELKICVDTIRPKITLQAVKLRNWPVAVEWNIEDENPNLLTLQLDYRADRTSRWMPLTPQQLARGNFGWSPRESGPFEVRLRVADKAENETIATTTVRAGEGAPSGSLPEPVVPDRRPGGNTGIAPGRLIMVNKRLVDLNYKIDNVGKSDVAAVEVWVTRDTRTWQKYGNAPKSPPFQAELHAEGRYGFTLVAVSGVGLSVDRPRAGDPPQIWVELDETDPVVRLTEVSVGQGVDRGKLTIRWVATDKNLGTRPIQLSYCKTTEGPWTKIGPPISNETGVYVWRMPENDDDLPFQFYVQIEATDRAGNSGSDRTTRPVAVDLNVPKASVIGVEAKPLR